MAESEVNVISHLLEVESQAAALIDDAQIESNKRITSAKANADETYYSKYREALDAFEKSFNQKIQTYETEHKNEVESFKSKIMQAEKDIGSFNSLLDKTLLKV